MQGISLKWQRYYDGPFLVLDVIGDVNYRVQHSTRYRNQVVHVDKMKKYLGDTPVSWIALPGQSVDVGETIPTLPELTFGDSFFPDLLEIYEGNEDGPSETTVPDEEETDEGLNHVCGNQPDEDNDFKGVEEGGGRSPLAPVQHPGRPKRTIVKPIRFRQTTYPDEEYSRTYATTESDKVNLSAVQQEDNATA